VQNKTIEPTGIVLSESPTKVSTTLEPEIATNTPKATPSEIRFAVIGDYGSGNQNEADVAKLIDSWNVDFILTTGDNNYPDGSYETIDQNIGQFFHYYIFPYHGSYGDGAIQNRFFPTLGNHDWASINAQPYLDYFTLPGNERYYDFSRGFVDFFAIDSDSNEPDGVGLSSKQAIWLAQAISNSKATWKIVYMHQPPYSSGYDGSIDWAQWPYQNWGATVVIGGHDHSYERLVMNGFPYFVNGLGGGAIYPFSEILEGSAIRFNADYGAMLVNANSSSITFQFITRANVIIDEYVIEK
jgi:tartrate-resistant acid phosphatase type 5